MSSSQHITQVICFILDNNILKRSWKVISIGRKIDIESKLSTLGNSLLHILCDAYIIYVYTECILYNLNQLL